MSKVNYKLVILKDKLLFQSKNHELMLFFQKQHVTGIYKGKPHNFTKRIRKVFSTSIKSDLTITEKKVVAFHLLHQIREVNFDNVKHTNYAQVFISCFK